MIQKITIIKVCGIVGSPVWVAHSIIAFCPHKGTLTDYFETVEVEILCFCEFTLFINVIETNPEVELVEQEGLDMVLLFPAGDLRQVASIGPTKLDMTHDPWPMTWHDSTFWASCQVLFSTDMR